MRWRWLWRVLAVSYGELVARAGRLARYLRSAGAGPETVVGLCLDRGAEMVTAIAGGVAGRGGVPAAGPGATRRRGWRSCWPTAGPGCWSGPRELLEDLPAGRVRVIELDDPAGGGCSWPRMPSASLPPGRVAAGQLAYVIYTSGSTGTPKGVAVTHAGLANLAAAQADGSRWGRGTGCWHSPRRGLTRRCRSWRWRWRRGRRWWCRAAGRGAGGAGELAGLVAAAGGYAADVAAGGAGRAGRRRRWARCGRWWRRGRRWMAELAGRWAAGGGWSTHYGPTETTVCATMSGPLARTAVQPPIGTPVANTRVFVLDGGCAAGAGGGGRGAVCRRGAAGAGVRWPGGADRGAVCRVPVRRAGERMYRTGDLAKWAPRRAAGVRRAGR